MFVLTTRRDRIREMGQGLRAVLCMEGRVEIWREGGRKAGKRNGMYGVE